MELNEKMIEAIVMSASVGQFGGQIVYETFKLSIDEFSPAKKQLFTHFTCGIVAFLAYFFTQDQFVFKASLLAFLSGVFAEVALKLLKKKNEASTQKTENLTQQVAELEKDAKIKELEEKLKSFEGSK